jgi:hypothetical protein
MKFGQLHCMICSISRSKVLMALFEVVRTAMSEFSKVVHFHVPVVVTMDEIAVLKIDRLVGVLDNGTCV